MTDFVQVARTRKRRGWMWEDTLLKRLNRSYSWEAYRLGGSSANLPDILAVSNKFGTMMAIEAKSGTTDHLVVRREQVERGLRFLGSFRRYDRRLLVLAFKFSRKKRMNNGEYGKRGLREYYLEFNRQLKKGERAPDITATYNGNFYTIEKGERVEVALPLFTMPFEKGS